MSPAIHLSATVLAPNSSDALVAKLALILGLDHVLLGVANGSPPSGRKPSGSASGFGSATPASRRQEPFGQRHGATSRACGRNRWHALRAARCREWLTAQRAEA